MAASLTLIVAQHLADFAALGSQVAVRELYPLGDPRVAGVGREVHPYWALHRDASRR